MIGGGRRLAGLRLGDRNAAARAEVDQFALCVGIEHAAAADDQGLLRAAQKRGGVGDFARVWRDATLAMHPLLEEGQGIVVGLGLHVLAEGERHRPALGRIGQNRHRPVQRRHDLFGPGDAVEIARHGPEAIVGADRPVAEILDLLQHRIGPSIGEDVAGDQEHRQPVDMRERRRSDHVGGARADRGGAGHHALASRRLGEGDRGMRHRLLVVRPVGRQRIAAGVERLAEASHVAVAEDGEHALEQPLLSAVDLDFLGGEEADHCLRGGQSDCFHGVEQSLMSARGLAPQHAQALESAGHALDRLPIADAAAEPLDRRFDKDRPADRKAFDEIAGSRDGEGLR